GRRRWNLLPMLLPQSCARLIEGKSPERAGPQQERLFSCPDLFCPRTVLCAPKEGQTVDLEGSSLALGRLRNWLCRNGLSSLVPGTGLEPARLATLDPKSNASANSAIPARNVNP